MSIYTDASLIVTPNSKKAGKLYALKGADLDVVRATTATYVGSDGLIKTALANEVRFDYTNGSCPSILVEPQRTNLFNYSEQFDNGTWVKTASTVTANSTTSPRGTMTADLIIESATTNIHNINKVFPVTSGVTYTFSVFLKSKERNKALIAFFNGFPLTSIQVDLQNGIVTTGTGTPLNAFIEEYTDNWFRVGFSLTSTSGANANFLVYSSIDGLWENRSYLGDGISGLYIWGAQLEAGANATSYIPTADSTVTRNADVVSKTGISSLIGQTEGTIFADLNITNNDLSSNKTIISLDDNSYYVNIIAARILNTNILNIIFRAGSVGITFSNMPIISNGNHKIAIRYVNGFASIFVDGILINTQVWTSSFTNPISQLFVGKNRLETPYLNDTINSLALCKTALTDQQCIALTTL